MGDSFTLIYTAISLSVFIPVVMLFFRFKFIIRKRSHRLFAYFILLSLFEWLISWILSLFSIYNIFISNIYLVSELLVISLFFYNIYKCKNWIFPGIVTLGFLCLYLIEFLNKSTLLFNNFVSSIVYLGFITLSVFYFLKLIRKQEVRSLLSFPEFYFVTGLLFYFAGGIFIISFSNYLTETSVNAAKALWLFHSFINLLSYIIYSIGFFKCKADLKY